MKKIKLLTIISVLMLVIFAFGMVSVGAETTPAEPPVAPVVTDPVQDPVMTDPVASEPATSATDPTDMTYPTDYSDPTGTMSVATEPETVYTRPTEYDEDYEPSTYSDYVSPPPVYTPGDQDFEKKDWEEIQLNIMGGNSGVGDFSDIQNDNSKGDKNSPLLLVLSIVFWCLALSALTFMVLYNPDKKKAVAKAPQSTEKKVTRRSSVSKHLDDYNDGF